MPPSALEIVAEPEAETFAAELGMQYMSVSSLTGEGVEVAFRAVVEAAAARKVKQMAQQRLQDENRR